jgi:hypothetical protein
MVDSRECNCDAVVGMVMSETTTNRISEAPLDWARVGDTVRVSVDWLARLRAGWCDVAVCSGSGEVIDVTRSVEHGWRSIMVRFANGEMTIDETDLELVTP